MKKAVKININLSNRALYTVLALVIVVLAGVAVYAQTVWDTSKTVYHAGSDVKVTIDGTDYDLQEAITATLIGGEWSSCTGGVCYDGKVGIGTTGPDASLEVINGTTNGGFMVSSAAEANGDLFIVDEGGNVGIGTPTPTGKLQVAGDEVRIGNAGTPIIATEDGDLYVEDDIEVNGNLGLNVQLLSCTEGLACDEDGRDNFVQDSCPSGYILTTCSPWFMDDDGVSGLGVFNIDSDTCVMMCDDILGNGCFVFTIQFTCMRITDIGNA